MTSFQHPFIKLKNTKKIQGVSHIYGTQIPQAETTLYALTRIPGIGLSTALKACKLSSLIPQTQWRFLTETQANKLITALEKIIRDQPFGAAYKRAIRKHTVYLKKIGVTRKYLHAN